MKPLDICEATSGLACTAIGETNAKPDTTVQDIVSILVRVTADQDSVNYFKHETTGYFLRRIWEISSYVFINRQETTDQDSDSACKHETTEFF